MTRDRRVCANTPSGGHPGFAREVAPEARADAKELGHVPGETRQILDQEDLECRRRAQRRGKELPVGLLVAREPLLSC